MALHLASVAQNAIMNCIHGDDAGDGRGPAVNAVFHLDVIRQALDLLALAAMDRATGQFGFAAAEEGVALAEARESLASLERFLAAPLLKTSAPLHGVSCPPTV
jgi:hypothetical protein